MLLACLQSILLNAQRRNIPRRGGAPARRREHAAHVDLREFHLLVVASIAGLLGHLVLKRRGLRSGFRVWLLIYVRSARIAAVLNRTLIGRIAATADGEQRDDQERDQ